MEDFRVKFRENESKYLTREDFFVQIFDENSKGENFPQRVTGRRGWGFQQVDQMGMTGKRKKHANTTQKEPVEIRNQNLPARRRQTDHHTTCFMILRDRNRRIN